MRQSVKSFLFFLNRNNQHNLYQPQNAPDRRWVTGRSKTEVGGLTIALLSLALVGITLSPDTLWAATISAASCSQTDVAAAVANVSNRDTVLIPAGTCTWSSALNVTKGITIMGAGMGATILNDNVSKGDLNCQGGSAMMVWRVNAPDTFRLTALTINGQVITSPAQGACGGTPHLSFGGTATGFRVDHLSFTNMQTAGMAASGALVGLFDHVTCTYDFKQCFVVNHDAWNGNTFGDGSWATSITWGGANMIYIEDSTCINSNVNGTSCIDGYDGARIVFRHNTVQNDFVGYHGSDSHQRGRSTRMLEAYSNTFTFTAGHNLSRFFWCRGGSCTIHSNTFTAPAAPPNAVLATSCRDSGVNCGNNPSGNWPPWDACDGSGPYDSNTNATGYRCIDQPGAGTSRLLSGDPPSGGNAQSSVEPIYVWNNTLNGVAFNTTSGSINVQANRDYFTSIARPGYTPLTYPHPLQLQGTSDITPPAPPQNLQAR